MPKPIQFKTLLLLMLLFSSSTNVFSEQIQKTFIDNQWQDSRYINHGDGTVTDIKTGLMWKQCVEGLSGDSCTTGTTGTKAKYTYEDAIEYVGGVTFPTDSHSDWRIPNIKELISLVAYDRYNPAINSTLFPNTPSYDFWSSSPVARFANRSWMINFNDGNDSYASNNANDRSGKLHVRLVRDVE